MAHYRRREMNHPSLLIASPIRYRPECPEVLPAFFDAVKALEWDGSGSVDYYFALHLAGELGIEDQDGMLEFMVGYGAPTGAECEGLGLGGRPDSRLMCGPRHDGEVQENLAYLRNRILRRWSESGADLLLMVDSDVILHPTAAKRMHQELQARGPLATVSLQLNNCPFEGGEPASNASYLHPITGRWEPVSWVESNGCIEVDRSGACTLYPRQALCGRFYWSPGYREEHQFYFDLLKANGFRHWLVQDASLVDHRMKREPSLQAALAKVVEMRGREGDQ
jgi:hypothetical protein